MSSARTNGNSNLSQTAARWFIRMQEISEDSPERSLFENWLMQSELHQAEYSRISNAWDGIDSIDDLKKMAQTHKENQFLNQSNRSKQLKKTILALSIGAITIFAGLIGQRQYQQWLTTPTMNMASESEPSQIITKTLEDGSQITLSGSSKIQVTYYPKQRHIALLQGEAIFEVTKNPDRPFVVETNTAKITVLGTRFAVNQLSKLVRVSVDHGSVQVESKAPASAIVLHNGEVAQIQNGQMVERKNMDARDYFKFADGTLIFNQADIFEIADEVARFNHENISAKGPSQEKISAVLDVRDINNFLHTLPKIANVSVEKTKDGIVIQANK